MGQRTIIMHPTLERATQSWLRFCRKYKSLIKEAKRNPLSVKFINGDTWYFRSEREGSRAYRGYHAEMICIDDFPLDEKIAKFLQRSRKMEISMDDLKKECQYCCREIGADGLEGFRCTNIAAIRIKDSSWCYPKNANEPCSICEYCRPIQDMEMTIDKAISHLHTYSSTMGSGQTTQQQHEESKRVAIDVMNKYQQLQADYETRLKADMVAMLTELKTEIEKKKFLESSCSFMDKTEEKNYAVYTDDISKVIHQRINALKGDSDGN